MSNNTQKNNEKSKTDDYFGSLSYIKEQVKSEQAADSIREDNNDKNDTIFRASDFNTIKDPTEIFARTESKEPDTDVVFSSLVVSPRPKSKTYYYNQYGDEVYPDHDPRAGYSVDLEDSVIYQDIERKKAAKEAAMRKNSFDRVPLDRIEWQLSKVNQDWNAVLATLGSIDVDDPEVMAKLKEQYFGEVFENNSKGHLMNNSELRQFCIRWLQQKEKRDAADRAIFEIWDKNELQFQQALIEKKEAAERQHKLNQEWEERRAREQERKDALAEKIFRLYER